MMPKGSLLLALLSLVFAVLFATLAAAQPQGIPRDKMVRFLAEHHREIPVARGLGSNGAVYEVFAASDGSTWTIAMTLPDGESFLLVAGGSWMTVESLASPACRDAASAEEQEP